MTKYLLKFTGVGPIPDWTDVLLLSCEVARAGYELWICQRRFGERARSQLEKCSSEIAQSGRAERVLGLIGIGKSSENPLCIVIEVLTELSALYRLMTVFPAILDNCSFNELSFCVDVNVKKIKQTNA
jgi:hypothetical protein